MLAVEAALCGPLRKRWLGTVLTLLGAGRPEVQTRQGREQRLGKLLEALGPLLPPAHPCWGPGARGRALGREARGLGDGTELNVRGPVSSPSPDLTVSPQTRCLPAREPPAGQDPTPWETGRLPWPVNISSVD